MEFQLREYYNEIREAMNINNWTAANAVKRFITNMASLRPIYITPEWSHIQFNQIGQQWNRLKYNERNAQQSAAVQALLNASSTDFNADIITDPTSRSRRRRRTSEGDNI